MNKSDLVKYVAECAGVSKAKARRCIDCYNKAVVGGLETSGKVMIKGFGTYSKVHRKAYVGRNPQTGEAIKIKGRNIVTFKSGKKLKDLK